MLRRLCFGLALLVVFPSVFAQAPNGKLQIHHIDMGQGDSAVLISPNGTVVLLDAGRDIAKRKDCGAEIGYLDQLGVKQIDYLFVSHYHYDHIDCVPEVLERFPLKGPAYDRGTDQVEPTTTTYKNYKAAVGTQRKTAKVGQVITLDDPADPVSITVLALSGHYKGGTVATQDENDLSLSVLVGYGGFREEIGGDLSGEATSMYQDVETFVSKTVGPLDVYKVHHHCSSHSSNVEWLRVTQPTVAVISTGDGNSYRHPASDCLERLHEADISRVFWTEQGAGGVPQVNDVIGGDITIEMASKATTYTVSYGNSTVETFDLKHPAGGQAQGGATAVNVGVMPSAPKFAWSIRADHYYKIGCPVVNRISKKNLQTGDTPPADKSLATCPTRPSN